MTPLETATAELALCQQIQHLFQMAEGATSKSFAEVIKNTSNPEVSDALEEAEEALETLLTNLLRAVAEAEERAALEDQRERFAHEDSYRWAGER